MHAQVHLDPARLTAICQRFAVKRLAIFGSALTDRFNDDSDLDMLVEFEDGKVPGLGFVALQLELSELAGREVDLHTYYGLSRYFRDDVSRQAEVRYEAAA